jgi:hypothetical protein
MESSSLALKSSEKKLLANLECLHDKSFMISSIAIFMNIIKTKFILSSHYTKKTLVIYVGRKFFLPSHCFYTFSLSYKGGKNFFFFSVITFATNSLPRSHIHHINISSFLIYTLISHIHTEHFLCHENFSSSLLWITVYIRWKSKRLPWVMNSLSRYKTTVFCVVNKWRIHSKQRLYRLKEKHFW